MTRTEQAELQELGMTPERLAENQAKVAAILHGDKLQVQAFEYSEAKPPKKRRSDAGGPRKPRPQPSEQAQGVLSKEQAKKLRQLTELREMARIQFDIAKENESRAESDWNTACAELEAHITEITTK
jgi:hypothetical protein